MIESIMAVLVIVALVVAAVGFILFVVGVRYDSSHTETYLMIATIAMIVFFFTGIIGFIIFGGKVNA